MGEILCPRCDSKHVHISRDTKATRKCMDCYNTWDDPKDESEMTNDQLIEKFKELCCRGIEVPTRQIYWSLELIDNFNCFCCGYSIGSKKEQK